MGMRLTLIVGLIIAWAGPGMAQPRQSTPVAVTVEDPSSGGAGLADRFAQLLSAELDATGRLRASARGAGVADAAYRVHVVITHAGRRGTTGSGLLGGLFGGISRRAVGERKQSAPDCGERCDKQRESTAGAATDDAAAICPSMTVAFAIDVRLTDVKSGEIRVVTEFATSQRTDRACPGLPPFDLSPMMTQVAQRAAIGVGMSIDPPIVRAVGGEGRLTIGRAAPWLKVGDRLALVRVAETVADPGTGRSISIERRIGSVQVESVSGDIAVAIPDTPIAAAEAIGAVARLEPPAGRRQQPSRR